MSAPRRLTPPLLALLASLALLTGCQTRRQYLLIVDQNAAGGQGCVFQAELGEGPTAVGPARLLLRSPLLRQPQDVLVEADGSFLVLDYYLEGGVGKVFRFSPDGTDCAEVAMPVGLVDPFEFVPAPDGSIWIVDKNADPLGLGAAAGKKTGTLWRWTQDRRGLEILATGPPLMAPAGVVFAGEEAYLLDADSFQSSPPRLDHDEGAIFRVRPHPQALEVVVRLDGLVSPLGLHRDREGGFFLVDVNADPVLRSRIHGAVYRVDPGSGETRLFANHEDFRDPVTCLPWRGGLLVVDANADPLGLGADGSKFHYGGQGRGGIYRVDLQTGAVALFLASAEFVNPIRLRIQRR